MKRRKGRLYRMVVILAVIAVAVLVTMICIRANDTRIDKNFHTKLFGENTYIFTPEDDPAKVQKTLDEIYEKQEDNQFGKERYAIYFMPGEYDESLVVDVGFYTQVAGLGNLPTDTKIPKIQCLARWLGDDENNHNACCNFWRSVENMTLQSNTVWAVSQATDMRRVQVEGSLYLHDDYGWCSGGFLADSNVENMVDSGSQQQWLSRNDDWNVWMGENWNMVFVGSGNAPTSTWPAKAYTAVNETPVIREKPFLVYDRKEGYGVYVPALRRNTVGISWNDAAEDKVIPISEFYVAKPEIDTADSINRALADGKNLLFTPGIYELDKPVEIKNPDTVVLGMGLATLYAKDGNRCINVADEDGIIIAGLLFDAGTTRSDTLMTVGSVSSDKDHSQNPICLSDLYFRVGGTPQLNPAKADTCIEIHSNDVIGDNFWIWRADHGDLVGWDDNVGRRGIVVNGDNVTMYALMVEHFEEYQTVWNGDSGEVYMYQSEIPYDVPGQDVWMSHDGMVNGYASFYVDSAVTDFNAYGLGIYLYNRDAQVTLAHAMEVPDTDGVKVHHICTVMLTGYPGMEHIINDCGKSVMSAGERQIIVEYENGLVK